MLEWAYCSIIHYNISLRVAKKLLFFIKKIIQCGNAMGRGYSNPSGTGMRFNLSSPLGMDMVAGKYMRIGYGDGECKTHLHPAPLPCLEIRENVFAKRDITFWRLQLVHDSRFLRQKDGDKSYDMQKQQQLLERKFKSNIGNNETICFIFFFYVVYFYEHE